MAQVYSRLILGGHCKFSDDRKHTPHRSVDTFIALSHVFSCPAGDNLELTRPQEGTMLWKDKPHDNLIGWGEQDTSSWCDREGLSRGGYSPSDLLGDCPRASPESMALVLAESLTC